MKQVKITVPTISAVYGRMEKDDIVRCSDAEAKEFVEELKCAKYDPPAPPAGSEE